MFGDGKANHIHCRADLFQQAHHLVQLHTALLYSIEGPLRHARPVEQQRRKMSRIEDIEVEMYRKMRDSLGLDPVEDRPAAVSKDGWRDMPDAPFLPEQVFLSEIGRESVGEWSSQYGRIQSVPLAFNKT